MSAPWLPATLLLLLLNPIAANARDLTRSDLKLIEKINQHINERPYLLNVWDCKNYARQKEHDLIAAGFSPSEIRFGLVEDEKKESHAVAEVLGSVGGKPVTVILDNRFTWTQTRATLEQFGYRWSAELP